MVMLFPDLSDDPAPLDPDAAALLAALPVYPWTQEVLPEQEAACRRLEKRGRVRVTREKSDPIATRPTWYAGRVP
jgi:hypothetical protein